MPMNDVVYYFLLSPTTKRPRWNSRLSLSKLFQQHTNGLGLFQTPSGQWLCLFFVFTVVSLQPRTCTLNHSNNNHMEPLLYPSSKNSKNNITTIFSLFLRLPFMLTHSQLPPKKLALLFSISQPPLKTPLLILLLLLLQILSNGKKNILRPDWLPRTFLGLLLTKTFVLCLSSTGQFQTLRFLFTSSEFIFCFVIWVLVFDWFVDGGFCCFVLVVLAFDAFQEQEQGFGFCHDGFP